MAIVSFKQIIRKNDVGLDVLAVKRTLVQLHISGASGMEMNRVAGEQFVRVLAAFQRLHGLDIDGTYGLQTHLLLAPHFDLRSRTLYRAARKRTLDVNSLSAQQAAQQLLSYSRQGKYHADNPPDMNDIEATAQGRAVRNQAGEYVRIDAHVMRVLVYLIEKGYRIGTYAICSDHGFDSPHGHAGGHAVDISTINGVSVVTNSWRCKANVLRLLYTLHAAGKLRPWQLISGGYGEHRDADCSRLSLPGADGYYGSATMAQHCNHVHVGY